MIKDGKASVLIEFKYVIASSPPDAQTRSVEVFDAAKDSAKKMQSSLSSSTYKIFGWMVLFTGSFFGVLQIKIFYNLCQEKCELFIQIID